MISRRIASVVIIGVTALLGLSIAKVTGDEPLAFSLGAAITASIALGIASVFQQPTAALEKETDPRKLMGMRIGVAGFCIAICGWLVAVFLSTSAGYFLVGLGVLIGFVGLPIHIFNMFRR